MAESLYEELLGKLNKLSPEKLAQMGRDVAAATASKKFIPSEGPQTMAYLSKADVLLFGGQAGGGKALSIQTLIPTPSGWTIMNGLQVGDTVFDDGGLPCRVVGTTEVLHGRPCYKVTFSDDSEIIADANHQWATTTQTERDRAISFTDEWRAKRRLSRVSRAVEVSQKPGVSATVTRLNRERVYVYKQPEKYQIRTTAQIAGTLDERHGVTVAGSINLPDAVLPLPPYLLGAWLGDGTSSSSGITIAEPEMAELVAHEVSSIGGDFVKSKAKYAYRMNGHIQKTLREMGLLKNKHIPASYLRASAAQRIALLQGLMDTDGYAEKKGGVDFCITNLVLAKGVEELILSLGCKVTLRESVAKLYGRVIGPKYRLGFFAPFPAFRMSRKLARQKLSDFRPTVTQRYIVGCEPIESVPVKCIQVDSPSSLYLAGRQMIPTHNSALGVGLAVNEHKNSLIMRRRYGDLSSLTKEAIKFHGSRNGFSSAPQPKLDMGNGKLIEFGACQHLGDEESWQGRAHDYIYFDESSQFLEAQVRFLMAWNRATGDNPGQRCRVIMGSNPPVSSDGDWLIRMFAPWIDPTHANPARPGELRWFITDPDGNVDVEVPDSRTITEWNGKRLLENQWLIPKSRTFIPSTLRDNPFLGADYKATLDSLPEPLRSAMRDGNFMASKVDDPMQIIPTDWIRAAQARWTPQIPLNVPMCAIGVDPAKGGADTTVLAPRYDGWYAVPIAVPGSQTPNGSDTAGLVITNRRNNATVVIDVGGGYGDAAFEHLRGNLPNIDIGSNARVVVKFDGSATSTARTSGGTLPFKNKRAEAIWKFKEALDPSQEGGSLIMLPPDPRIMADLSSYRLLPRAIEAGVIQVESKQELKTRLGRSPDFGDAIFMAWSEGNKAITHAKLWNKYADDHGIGRNGSHRPKSVDKYADRRR